MKKNEINSRNLIKETDQYLITNKILRDMINLFDLNKTKVFITNCDGERSKNYLNWKNISFDNGYIVLNKSVENFHIKKNTSHFYKDGAHWNPQGNKLFGNLFHDEILEHLK